MGRATIVENVGAGLYKIRLEYDLAALEDERQQLRVKEREYWQDLLEALDERDALRQDRHALRVALEEVMQQWKDNLLDIGVAPPPAVPEEADENGFNPHTGEPYTEEERRDTLEREALAAINAERAAAGLAPLDRGNFFTDRVRDRISEWAGTPLPLVPDLTGDDYLGMLVRLSDIDREGQTVHGRLLAQAAGVPFASAGEVKMVGPDTPSGVVARMMADPTTRAKLLTPNATQAGVGYGYSPQFPATHVWAAISAKLLAPPASNPAFFASPAGQGLKDFVSSQLGPDAAAGLDTGQPGGGGGGASGDGSWGGKWEPDTEYGVGATIIADRSGGWGLLAKNVGRFGRSGLTEPAWPAPMVAVIDNEIQWVVMAVVPPAFADPVFGFYA
jgi:hypothetical protein